jgi:glycosyltransferase involved in cell wall biosynthesis
VTESRGRLVIMVTSALTATSFLSGYLGFLRRDGWSVVLICSDGEGLEELADSEGVRLHRVQIRREPSPVHDLRSLWATFILLRRLRPDALVYATPKASLLGALAGWSARVPRRIYELWGLRLETAIGLDRIVLRLSEWVTARLSTVVVAISRSLARRAEELGVAGGKRPLVLGAGSSHGVDVSHYRRDADFPPMDTTTVAALGANALPVVGFIGRLHPDKGIDTLLESLSLCARRGVPLQALLVGGDEGVAGTAASVRTASPVHLVGHVPDIRPYLARMDVLVLPSRREGFPNVVLQAAAMEVPAIVSDATGCIDAFEFGLAWAAFPVGDSGALADLLATVANGAQTSLGVPDRAHVIAHFGAERVWADHSEVFATGLRPQTAEGIE